MYSRQLNGFFSEDVLDTSVTAHVNKCVFQVRLRNEHLGSCFQFDNKHLLTCYHVVQDVSSTDHLTVAQDGVSCVVYITFVNPSFDVAVLQFVNGSHAPDMLKISQEDLSEGTTVFGSGYTRSGDKVCTEGVVSCVPTGPALKMFDRHTVTILPDQGMTGGAIVDRYGRLLGMIQCGSNLVSARSVPKCSVRYLLLGMIQCGSNLVSARSVPKCSVRYLPWFIIMTAIAPAGLDVVR
jgi:hypothetical protein